MATSKADAIIIFNNITTAGENLSIDAKDIDLQLHSEVNTKVEDIWEWVKQQNYMANRDGKAWCCGKMWMVPLE